MSLKSFLVISTVVAAVIPHNGIADIANPDDNTEDGTGALNYTSTYPVGGSQTSSQRKAVPKSRSSRSVQECSNYKVLSSPDRAQGAILLDNHTCDSTLTPGWYRFSGDAGDKMATSCVPLMRCGTHTPGWMNGNHPATIDGIVQRQVCFTWYGCCSFKTTISVRNCGQFYVYKLPHPPWSSCLSRYCGNALVPLNKTSECGGNLTSLTGQVTSPGYPKYMEPIACHWTIKAPLDGNILLCFNNLALSPKGCLSKKNIITIDTNGQKETFCTNQKNYFCLIGNKTARIRYQSTDWKIKLGFKLRYIMINGDLNNVEEQSKWKIIVKAINSSAIQVSWHTSVLNAVNKYGYVVVWKSANQRSVYVLTEPDAATITITGLTGGTEYTVQVVALVNERNATSLSLNGSVIVKTSTKKYLPGSVECTHFKELSTWDRAESAPVGKKCDKDINTQAWYRFTGQAGTQIATSCVPTWMCGAQAPGWMLGTHPEVQDGIVTRTVCFHSVDDCCLWHNTVRVRNCGGFYVYLFQKPPLCSLRYCGSIGAYLKSCGKSITDMSGTLTSPGYPTRIYLDSKCQWNFTAPSPSGAIAVIVEHLSIPISTRCLVYNLTLEDDKGLPVGKACGVRRCFTWVSQGSAKLKFHTSIGSNRRVGFKARYFIFKDSLTNISQLLQLSGVSAPDVNSTAIRIRWSSYSGGPSVTEYLIICVPDDLPLNATVFTTNVTGSQSRSLVVTGLMKYTNYTIQIVVQNSRSSFQYLGSKKIRKRTSEDVPSEGPTHISATTAKDNAISVSWQPISKLARNGIITDYVIYYNCTSDNLAESNISIPVSENMSMTANVEGLKSATEYRIQMAGVTSVGVGAKSKAEFAISGCHNVSTASKRHLTWIFTSPRHPDNYLSNLNCTWLIDGSKVASLRRIFVVFEKFHLEKTDACSGDHVSFTSPDGQSKRLCGRKQPFAVELSKQSGQVVLRSDGGLEESGFKARTFVVTKSNTFTLQGFNHSQLNNLNEVVSSWSKPKNMILEYVVIYRKISVSNSTVWTAKTTNVTKAVLTGIQPGRSYSLFIFYTAQDKVYMSDRQIIEASGWTGISTTTETEVKATTRPPKAKDGMYGHGEKAGDSMIPNTAYYSKRCFRVNVPDDGIQLYGKIHHMIYICRNGLLLFETPHLIHWPYRFSEQRHLLDKTDILAPYWAVTDVDEAFTSNTSKVYYQVYYETEESKPMLLQATYDVWEFFNLTKFEATWVLKVTWCNLSFPGAKKLSPIPENTFQAVVITNGLNSFTMYNYPRDGIQWSAPTEKENYKYFTGSRGLPVVGLNLAEHNDKPNYFYDVQGSGTVSIEKIDELGGLTIYKGRSSLSEIKHQSPRKWFFRLETMTNHTSPKKSCITWLKKQPDPRKFTEHLEPCPCTYRQAFWDERFYIDYEGWGRVCAYLVFESEEGWNQGCCYNRITGALIKGYPGGGTPQRNYNARSKRKKLDNDFTWCCVYSPMCHLYYEKRPSDDCTRYERPDWSWLWGDPHFVTLDGLNYTFNGLGEYIMADINNGLFQLQARTKLVEGGGKATVFVSAVAKQAGSSAVQVNLKHGLEVLVNGTVIDHATLTNTTTLYNGSVALSRPDTSSITVLFPSGISVKMTDVKDSLAIVLAAPERFKNKTRGLLGVWNDDPEDDLTTPTGRVVPTDATGRMIHYEFGQKWQVTESTSLFTYKKEEGVDTFSDPSFMPMFIEDFTFTSDAVKREALAKCEGDVNCLFDAALTNDVTMGTSTKIIGSKLKNESEALKNSVPKFVNDSSTFYVTVNTTARLEIFAKDDDGDPLIFEVSGILPESLDTNTDSGRSIVISWEVTMDKVKFEVTVMDDKGAVSLLRPEVHVCACHNGGYCSPDSNNNVFADSTNDTFVIMPCTCIHGYKGRFCENNLDACQANLNPCYPGVKCTDLPPPAGVFGYRCGPCPRGFTGDGATCLDLDECQRGNQGCSQICVNTPGSFVCDCNQGYRLSIDQKTCNDIDECFPSSDCMQKCKNTEGSYTCECNDGFKVDTNNPKQCVPKLPCSNGNHGCQHICYMKDGRQQCACHQGYKLMDDQKTCKDIDECSTRKYRCNQYCHNTEGSYSCSCKKGFRMDTDGVTCVDVDECMELTYQCPDPSQICLNTAGSYKCVCGPRLYLTVNNTCREILPGATTPPPGPAPTPKPPTDNEKNNAVRITVKDLNISQWNERLDNKFKQSVAKAVTFFCASKDEECKKDRKRARRALDYILYTADQVHLLPGFPKQINLKSRDLAAVIAFYVEFPPEVVSTSGDSIEGGILVEVLRSAKADIEKALNRTISSITLNKKGPTTEKKPEKMNIYVIIGVSLGGVLFISIVAVLIRRYRTHNATFRIKRKQEKKERKMRATNVNNAYYDDGMPGEFQLGPTQSTTDILEGSGNKYVVQTSGLGIDNLEVNVK